MVRPAGGEDGPTLPGRFRQRVTLGGWTKAEIDAVVQAIACDESGLTDVLLRHIVPLTTDDLTGGDPQLPPASEIAEQQDPTAVTAGPADGPARAPSRSRGTGSLRRRGR